MADANNGTKSTVGSTTKFLGVVLAVPSIISFLQHVLHVGLVPVFSDFVNYYRALFAPVFAVLYMPIYGLFHWFRLDWTIPSWVRDLHTLSTIGCGIVARGIFSVDPDYDGQPVMRTFVTVFSSLLVGFTGLGLLILVTLPIYMFRLKHDKADDKAIAQVAWTTLIGIFLF
ncbi:MAG: hypothetical protein ACXU8O_07985, partial [Asticcacaulis sp.]